jgi:hypothetical protein
MPRSALETLNNGEQSLDFTYYEQTTNRFWSPHLAESRVFMNAAFHELSPVGLPLTGYAGDVAPYLQAAQSAPGRSQND